MLLDAGRVAEPRPEPAREWRAHGVLGAVGLCLSGCLNLPLFRAGSRKAGSYCQNGLRASYSGWVLGVVCARCVHGRSIWFTGTRRDHTDVCMRHLPAKLTKADVRSNIDPKKQELVSPGNQASPSIVRSTITPILSLLDPLSSSYLVLNVLICPLFICSLCCRPYSGHHTPMDTTALTHCTTLQPRPLAPLFGGMSVVCD